MKAKSVTIWTHPDPDKYVLDIGHDDQYKFNSVDASVVLPNLDTVSLELLIDTYLEINHG
jgi:hypothetical protein